MPLPDPLIIGTRGSPLALTQTGMVRDALAARHPGVVIETSRISTRGDRVQDRPLADIGGKALFIAEIEAELRSGLIHLAVHSGKDMPSDMPDDMLIAAFLPRADPRDVLVSSVATTLDALPSGARVGTSSPRRAAQLRARRQDLEILDIRGNVDTRLGKLDAGSFDALILAAAGLIRLGLSHRIAGYIPADEMIPCAAQGAIAIEVAVGNDDVLRAVSALNHESTARAVIAERAFLAAVGGSCDTPLGAHAYLEGDDLILHAVIASASGQCVHGKRRGHASMATALGEALAEQLMANGGAELLNGVSGTA